MIFETILGAAMFGAIGYIIGREAGKKDGWSEAKADYARYPYIWEKDRARTSTEGPDVGTDR